MRKKILVTGGAGYIGSHTCLELLNAGFDVTVVDNLSNSKITGLERVELLTDKKINFIKVDLLDKDQLETVFETNTFHSVIHFAGLKAVGESVFIPLEYYQNNLSGTINLLEVMQKFECKNFIFSSSATVYGDPVSLPIDESFALSATNPYGRSKLIIEEVLQDLYRSDNSWNMAVLRYFNPVGAHKSGQIGEDPNGIPNNLIPYISQVAVGKLETLSVYGDDYDTADGTGVRDYIHVVDLAKGHISAITTFDDDLGCVFYNLGTGTGYSVIEMVKAFEKASGNKVDYKIVARREGDIAACYADPDKANKELGWFAEKGLEEMCEDTWRWQSMNPNGFN